MVSLVIVSHSSKIAEGVQDLVNQVTQGKVAVMAAGAFSEDTLGTHYDLVKHALDAADSADGTLVLADLGSAVMTAEMVLEDMPPARRRRILLCEAPLVEGAVAAAAQIAAGASLDEAAAEARGALMPKVTQLGARPGPHPSPDMPNWDAQALIAVSHPLGLHAGPASLFVQAASQFQSDVRIKNVTRNSRFLNAKSINNVSLLDIRRGHDMLVAANGPDARTAVARLRGLVEGGFIEQAGHAVKAAGRRFHSRPRRPVALGALAAVEDVVSYVTSHYAEPLTSAGMADMVFLHPRYFCTVFKAYMGTSFTDYLSRVRVAWAKELLTSTTLPVSEVAQRVGFRDPNYFSRAFKRVQGLSPVQFRRQYCSRPDAM